MNKLLQLAQAIGCFYDMEVGNENLNGYQRVKRLISFWIEEFVFINFLMFGIWKGDVKIPLYLGDGYSFDNFDRKEGDEPEYNYWLHCYIANNGEFLK